MSFKKTCFGCEQTKDITEFYKHKAMADGHLNKCKPCKVKDSNSWISLNMEQHIKGTEKSRKKRFQYLRVYNRKKKYNLTDAQHQKMLLEQNNLCAICLLIPETLTKPLYVDHDHKTGKVRGLLCQKCNTAFGMFLESEEIMQNAISYSKRTK